MKEASAFWQARPYLTYRIVEDDSVRVWCSGILVRDSDNQPDLLSVGKDALDEKLDYNTLHGSYRIVIFQKKSEQHLFFGDNTGAQGFFLDRDQHNFSDSFLSLCRERKTFEPDYHGVAQLLDFGQILGSGTVVRGIEKTEAGKTYLRDKKGIFTVTDKGLHLLSEMPSGLSLDDVFKPVLTATAEKSSCAVCTGGTDSRAVLSDLYYNGIVPELVLTVHPDNPDVAAAKAVAEKLGKSLNFIDFTNREKDWIKKGQFFLDGSYDAVLAYRHLQKARYVRDKGFFVEYGGVGGEFYKNAYCNLVRNWRLKTTRQRLEVLLENRTGIRRNPMYSEAMDIAEKENEDLIRSYVDEAQKEEGLLPACNHLGFSIISSGIGAITNGYAAACCKIDPLMDRSLVASASQERVSSHTLHRWQRRQIARYAPQLSDLKTDQGYNTSMKNLLLLRDTMKRMAFLEGRMHARIRRKLGLKWKSLEQRYWDDDYLAAREEPLWNQCLDTCRFCGILAKETTESDIPLTLTGYVMQLGLLFGADFCRDYDGMYESFLE